MYIVTTTTYYKDGEKSINSSIPFDCEKEADLRFNIERINRKDNQTIKLYKLKKLKQVA